MPSGGALFGSSTGIPGSTGGIKHLIEMRAGKMSLKGKVICLIYCIVYFLRIVLHSLNLLQCLYLLKRGLAVVPHVLKLL